jgi:hypothetical protein
MKNGTFVDFNSENLGTIEHLIDYFEKRHIEAFPHHLPIPDSDYTTDFENRRLHTRLLGATTCLKELRESILSSETRE